MAVRIVLKRSSIPNKRPNADLLDPGELALNTNALTPGLFFEADNNSIVKVGPTAVGENPPTLTPSLGETYYDTANNSLSVGTIDPETAAQVWKEVSAPYLGGTNGYVVFVAPEFPTSSDAIKNDGQSSPFRSLNRAVIEIAKQSIATQNESDAGKNNRFTIVVSNGICPVYNGPGLPLPVDTNADNIPEFNVVFEGNSANLPDVLNLQQFNPETGGLLVPRGTSIIGTDLRKVELRPSYVPTYKNPSTGEGSNQPITSILKWTGNSYVSSFTVRDKRSLVSVSDFTVGPAGEGVFVSSRPHCFNFNDRIFFSFAPGTNTTPLSPNSAGILSGYYFVKPLGVDTFELSFTDLTGEPNYVERSQLPASPQGIGYLAECYWQPYSHHRLRSIYPASKAELDEFYTKVQLAFPKFFLGSANQAEVVNPGETEIVGPVPNSSLDAFKANTTDNASPYVQNVSIRSNYGLCGLENDGLITSGFRSALGMAFTVASIQNDPSAYEIYTTVQDPVTLTRITDWFPLQYATWATIPSAQRPENQSLVPIAAQTELLNATDIINIRYYYSTLKSDNGKSFGIPDFDNDFRHFAVKATNNAYIQVETGWTIGCAVGFWSTFGGSVTAENCASNFGSNALRSEGFTGIGGVNSFADPADSGFTFSGIRMPQIVLPSDTTSKLTFELGANILSVVNQADGIQEITIGSGFLPVNILPFSLEPGTAIYSQLGTIEFRAFFTKDKTVKFLENGGAILYVRSIDSTFPLGNLSTIPQMKNWTPPFIKRWNDPRSIGETAYSLILGNTQANHRNPQPGGVLRLNQNNALASSLLRPNVQFDPGPNGGWGKVFSVALAETEASGIAPQYNEVLLNRSNSNTYFVGLILCDSGRPWVEERNTAHGEYVTYNNRNWYAASNDEWSSIYYTAEGAVTEGMKLPPTNFDSSYAVTNCTENQEPVAEAYQGEFAPDPLISLYPDGTYFRGSQPNRDNYGFDFVVNIDNGTPDFGLLRHNVSTGLSFTPEEEIKPEDTVIRLTSVANIPNPLTNFVVMSITDGTVGRKEFVQVLKVDTASLSITVIRGVYDTLQTSSWPLNGTTLLLQRASDEVLASDYDFDWSPSKSAMIRFLEVMGYSIVDIQKVLSPQIASRRSLTLSGISASPKDGFALSTGPWPFEFSTPSQTDALSHSFHSVGRLNYAKGLPKYLKSEIPTKQYYDFLSTQVWSGAGSITGGDELGNLPTSGVYTQTATGRPYGTYTSSITDYSRTGPTPGSGDGGGGTGDGTVQAVYTGEGLVGGPITIQGTISLLPPVDDKIGGVKAGKNIQIQTDGTIDATGGTVESIDFTTGLAVFSNDQNGGTITTSGTVALKVATSTEIGGIIPGIGLELDPDTGVTDLKITSDLNGQSMDTAISQFAANILDKSIEALTGANVLAGTYDARAGQIVSVTPIGASKGFVIGQTPPPPSTSIDNYYLIVTVGGPNPKPPLPPGFAGAGDWFICQAEAGVSPAWILIDFENISAAADNISVRLIPGIDTAGNVQSALEAIELQVQDRIEFAAVDPTTGNDALNVSISAPVPTSNDGTTLSLSLKTASETDWGATKLTSDFTGTSKSLALTQFAANQLNTKVDALTGSNVLAGTYSALNGTVLTVTPAGSPYLTVGQNCPPADQVPDNYYVLVTKSGTQGPPGAVVPSTGIQSSDWFIVQRDGATPTWITIDFENDRTVTASQVILQPSIPGLNSGNVQGALQELETKAEQSIYDIVSSTSNTSGIRVQNSAETPQGRTTTLSLLPATGSDLGGVFVIPGTGLNLSPSNGALGLTIATTNLLGGIKVGGGLDIAADGTLSVAGLGGIRVLDDLSSKFDGITTQFTLSLVGTPFTPIASQYVLIVVGGVVQGTPTNYSVTGTTITFTSPPPSGASFYGITLG
jgi:hypothetical protein